MNKSISRYFLLTGLVFSIALVAARPASANAILKLQATNGSPYYSLTSILNGTVDITSIVNGSPSAGSINVTNDVAGGITSLTLYYYGVTGPANDAGSTLSCQNFNFGGGNTTCSVYDPINGMSYANGASTPNNLPLASYAFTWTFPTAQTGNFNIAWSSFSGSGYTGCIAGTPTCTPVSTSEPATTALLGAGLLGLLALNRRRASQ